MASKKAVLMAYEVISANAPLIKADTDHSYRIMIHSWHMALQDIDDKSLSVGVERFLREVTEVNRSLVISAKLRELCLPKEIPFNEYEVVSKVKEMINAGRDIEALKKIREQTDPILWNLVMDYPFDAIQNATLEQLPTIYAQLRNDYRLRHQKQQIDKHNEILGKMMMQQSSKGLLMEMR